MRTSLNLAAAIWPAAKLRDVRKVSPYPRKGAFSSSDTGTSLHYNTRAFLIVRHCLTDTTFVIKQSGVGTIHLLFHHLQKLPRLRQVSLPTNLKKPGSTHQQPPPCTDTQSAKLPIANQTSYCSTVCGYCQKRHR